jgi:hypothetical protein
LIPDSFKALTFRTFYVDSSNSADNRTFMNRSNAILAILASANGRTLSPVQLQKAAFLLDRNGLLSEGAGFHFEPYDYGPFDKSVYDEAETLRIAGLAEIGPAPFGRWKVYSATQAGIEQGQQVLAGLTEQRRNYVQKVTEWVRAQSFSSLVKSIYQQYPEMRVNSVFQD